MGIPANPPPQSKMPDKLFNDDELRGYFNGLQEDLYRIWLRTGGGTDEISEIVETTGTATGSSGRLRAIMHDMANRIEDLESRSTDSGVNHKLAIINKRIDELIETLIEEIRALDSTEFEAKLLSYQSLITNELELLNARVEEAFETGIDRGDAE